MGQASRPLLVVDFDGTLARRVDDPGHAVAAPGAMDALESLAEQGVHVAVLSGRGREDLLVRLGPLRRVLALGSFGAEGLDGPLELTAEQIALRQHARTLVVRAIEDFRPAWMESKPLGAAAHLRPLRPDHRAEAHAAVAAAVASNPGVYVRHEAHTAEVSIMPLSKAESVRSLRARYGPDLCIVAGDDHSDAEAAGVLSVSDWFVVVSDLIHATTTCRVAKCADPEEFVELLRSVARG
jgi:trehalose 6-phosphate phosphatase